MPIPRFWREIKQRYKGIGSVCKNCEKMYFPPRKICPECRRESFQNMEPVELDGRGEVVTYTEIHEPHTEFDKHSPYIMAIVEMKEGERLTGHLVNVDLEDVESGMKVEATMRKLGEESRDGMIYYGYKFWPVDE